MTKHSWARLIASVIGLLVGSTVGFAQDAKTYPGYMCVSHDDYAIYSGGDGAIRSSFYANDEVRVFCPVVRDHTTNTNGVIDWFVRMYDTSTSGGVSCTLFAWGKFGQLDDSLQLATTPSSQTGTFEYSAWGLFNGPNAANGTYGMICALPATNSAIFGYRVIERQQTD